MGTRGLAFHGYIVPRATTTTNKTTAKRPKHNHTKALKKDVWIELEIKKALAVALNRTEGVLSMPRVDIMSICSGGFC